MAARANRLRKVLALLYIEVVPKAPATYQWFDRKNRYIGTFTIDQGFALFENAIAREARRAKLPK